MCGFIDFVEFVVSMGAFTWIIWSMFIVYGTRFCRLRFVRLICCFVLGGYVVLMWDVRLVKVVGFYVLFSMNCAGFSVCSLLGECICILYFVVMLFLCLWLDCDVI